MNGIVTGKIEKTAGSMVFKSVRSAIIPTNNYRMGLSYQGITNPYVKFVNIKGEINIMSISMINFYSSGGSYSTDMKSNSGEFYDDFVIYRDNDEDSVGIQLATANTTLNLHFSSFEVGTLEIA